MTMNRPAVRGISELDQDDVQLFDAAASMLDRVHDPVEHVVASAVRGSSGQTYLGVHLGSRRINVCAESSAIANAVMAGDLPITTFVAVCRDHDRTIVTNPCGVCRELMTTYGKQAAVIVDADGTIGKVRAAALMPSPWMFPHEQEWTTPDLPKHPHQRGTEGANAPEDY